jgi:hypothetical protein
MAGHYFLEEDHTKEDHTEEDIEQNALNEQAAHTSYMASTIYA